MKSLDRKNAKEGLPRMESNVDEQAHRERIAKKAYELYEKRGPSDGCDVEDWLEAERLILEQLEDQRSVKRRSRKNDATEKR